MRHQRLHFSRMSAGEQRALFEETGPVWTEIFGVPATDLEGYWFGAPAAGKASRETVVHVLRDEHGAVCGTLTVKYYDVEHEGREVVLVKLGVGIRASARGSRFTLRCVATEAVYHLLKYGLREVWFFSTMIHPVTYQIAARVPSRFYPYFDRPQDPGLAAFAGRLAERFGLVKADSRPPFVYREARSAVEGSDERSRWREKDDPAVRFFLDHCPDYAAGECFVFLAPVTAGVLARALAVYLRGRFVRVGAARRSVTGLPV